jgi:MFS transporter, SP family, solute carrier family 2 (facilitated glucose transporter), member 1
LDQINEEAIAARSQAQVTMKEMFGRNLYWPLTLAMFMMISQQLSGINAAMFYSTQIFKGAGLKDQCKLIRINFNINLFKGPNYATIAMGAINMSMTLVSVYLV